MSGLTPARCGQLRTKPMHALKSEGLSPQNAHFFRKACGLSGPLVFGSREGLTPLNPLLPQGGLK